MRFELAGPDEAQLLRLRSRIEDLCSEVLPAVLSDVFDELVADDEVLEISRLDVQLGELTAAHLDPQAIAEATRRALRGLPPPRPAGSGSGAHRPARGGGADSGREATPGKHSLAAYRLQQYVEYLMWGDFGAGDQTMNPGELLPEAATDDTVLRTIRDALEAAPGKQRRAAIMRLLATAPDALTAALAERMRPAMGTAGMRIPASTSGSLRARADAVVNSFWPEERRNHRTGPGRSESQRGDESDAPTGEDRDLIQAPNAGVVLLHVFFPQLFRTLELVKERHFRNEAARCTAVRLVHYLAGGEVGCDEPLLVVPKLLCGLGPETPVLADTTLDPEQIALADRLIESAIGHWTKLGNTSPAGLRETFLSRTGVLRGFPHRPRLIIERRGVDVLLGSMPWALSPVRLPWLERPLPVDWQ